MTTQHAHIHMYTSHTHTHNYYTHTHTIIICTHTHTHTHTHTVLPNSTITPPYVAPGRHSIFQVTHLPLLQCMFLAYTGSCEVAGYDSCCTDGDCQGDPANCFCDANCHGFGDCCSDVPVDCFSTGETATLTHMLYISMLQC